MNELALFAGAGGGLLATKWLLGWRTIAYVEREPYCVDVLKARMRDGLLDDAPIWDDANTFDGTAWRGVVDIVSAGFPCQPFSVAGKKLAGADERNGWPATIRIIRECGPRLVLLENVPNLLAGSHGYFGQVLADLAQSGFDAVWGVRSALSVGAPHIRKRLFVLAYAHGAQRWPVAQRLRPNGADAQGQETGQLGVRSEDGGVGFMETAIFQDTNTQEPRLQNGGQTRRPPREDEAHGQMAQPRPERRGHAWWANEPRVGRVAHGVANRVDRIKAIGNGQVPQVVAEVWRQLLVERVTWAQ